MKSIRKMVLCLGVAAICLTVTPLQAQELFTGSFTLPSQTRWATAVLPAGHYNFTLDQIRGTQLQIIRISRGTESIGMVVVQTVSEEERSDSSSMLIVDRRVRSLHLAALGATYYFSGHKNDSELVAARRGGVPGVSVIPVLAK